jgi:vacuolar-type H+-ATPase subunit C/Vma6
MHASGVDGSTFQVDDTVIWGAAAEERRWIYLQMDNDLRATLAPLLFYFELNTLVFCLRSLETPQSESMVDNLEKSLLAAELKNILRAMATPAEVVAKLEKFLGSPALDLDGLAAAYGEGGVQKCEELIRRRFFEQVFSGPSHPEVVSFFCRIIDLKNTMTMAKCLRWKKQVVPGLIDGGHIRLRKADRVPTAAGVVKMVRRCTGGLKVTAGELHPVNLESLLYGHLSRTMARQMRSGNPVECCMGYVWHCFAASRKRSGEYHAALFAEHFPGTGEIVQ